MIGVDWGTSSFRAYRFDAAGAILGRVEAARGIMTVSDGAFAAVLRELVGPWLAEGECRILMCGMVGSRQGWREASYLPCPASPRDIAAALVAVPFDGGQILLVPGLSDHDPSGVPEVMRGEETQLIGVLPELAGDGLACLPGSHSKWARLEGGRIAGFSTFLSGEAFAAIRAGTILGRMMRDAPSDAPPDAPPDATAFARGVARSGAGGGLLHHLFGVRTLGLFGELSETSSASYLSGLLIGHEVRAALIAGTSVHLVGSVALCDLYTAAIAACGGKTVVAAQDAAARGLALIAKDAPWTSHPT